MSEKRAFRGHAATVVIFTAIALAFLYLLFKLSGVSFFGNPYQVRAAVSTAGTLTQGTSVTMAGARVGTVTSVTRRGAGAVANLRITNDSVTPLPRDSRAVLRVRTPLGENYVEIRPGHAHQTIPSGGLVKMDPSRQYVTVDQLLSVLQGKTRTRARRLVQGLGGALGGRGQRLHATVHNAANVLHSGTAITNTLYGEREKIGQLVDQVGDVATALGNRDASIRALARQGLTTFRAVGARDQALRALLDELPSTLRQVRSTTRTLGSVSDTATPVLANLGTAVNEVRPAVVDLKPGAGELNRVVHELGEASPPLRKTLRSISHVSPRLVRALPKVDHDLCQVNPMLDYLKPYTEDVLNFVADFGSTSNSYDAIGHTIRLMPVLSDNSLFALPPAASKLAYKLLHEGLAQKALPLTQQPYPKPGLENSSASPNGPHIMGPAQVKASGYKFPHLLPHCPVGIPYSK